MRRVGRPAGGGRPRLAALGNGRKQRPPLAPPPRARPVSAGAPFRYCGRDFSAAEIDWVRALIAQRPLPDPALDTRPQPRLAPPRPGRTTPARRLAPTLRHPPRPARNLLRNPALRRRRLPQRELDPRRQNPRPRQARPPPRVRPPRQGHLPQTASARLENRPEPIASHDYRTLTLDLHRPAGCNPFDCIGSACWARTSDPLINSQLLYQTELRRNGTASLPADSRSARPTWPRLRRTFRARAMPLRLC